MPQIVAHAGAEEPFGPNYENMCPLFKMEYDQTCAATTMFQTRRTRVKCKTIVSTREGFLKRPGVLGIEAWLPRRKVVEFMDPNTYAIAQGQGGGPWFYTMPVYEVVKASSKRERDWGHLVFTDVLVKRVLLVMVLPSPSGQPGFTLEDYAALTKWHAHRFMAMAMCIFHDDTPVEWVRATYVKEDEAFHPEFGFDQAFLHSAEKPPYPITDDHPPIFTVTPQSVEPCLLASDIKKIDSIRAQDPESPNVAVPESVRNRVLGDRDTRLGFEGSWWQEKHYRMCSYGPCSTSKDRGLHLCSRCKIQYYCGAQCQKLAWPDHKRWCRAGF
ncbi:hypothetical protein FPV67DRAFT_307723 [Lyophyllum atratum]|nr:hypothetical protein FPV67DRAFT_307723 [Lyophyllum atratum]